MAMHSDRHNCYCAFCRTPRRVHPRRSIGPLNVLGAALGAALVMMALWQGFDARVTVVFVIMLALAEVFSQLRWRLSLTCQQCGFDPILYRRAPNQAAEKVKMRLETRRLRPADMMASPLRLPALTAARAATLRNEEEESRRPALPRSL